MFVVCSCMRMEMLEMGEFADVSIDENELAQRGNCLPFELGEVSINKTIEVTDGEITSLTFLSENEIACVTRMGTVFIIDIETASVNQIADFGSTNYPWNILAHNDREMLVYHYDLTDDPGSHFFYELAWLDRDGVVYWHEENVGENTWNTVYGPFFDGFEYYFISRGRRGYSPELFALKSGGNVAVSLPENLGYQDGKIPGEDDFIWHTQDFGPYFFTRDESGYSSFYQWNSKWNEGLLSAVLDDSGRIISFVRKDLSGADNFGSMVILEAGDSEPVIVNFYDDLGFEKPDDEPVSPKIASNGETILILYSHNIVKYENGSLEIIRDNLDVFSDGYYADDLVHEDGTDIPFLAQNMLVDSTCEKYLIFQGGSYLVGGGDEISVNYLGSKIVPNIQFTPDLHRACVALENGSVVVLDIDSSANLKN